MSEKKFYVDDEEQIQMTKRVKLRTLVIAPPTGNQSQKRYKNGMRCKGFHGFIARPRVYSRKL